MNFSSPKNRQLKAGENKKYDTAKTSSLVQAWFRVRNSIVYSRNLSFQVPVQNQYVYEQFQFQIWLLQHCLRQHHPRYTPLILACQGWYTQSVPKYRKHLYKKRTIKYFNNQERRPMEFFNQKKRIFLYKRLDLPLLVLIRVSSAHILEYRRVSTQSGLDHDGSFCFKLFSSLLKKSQEKSPNFFVF